MPLRLAKPDPVRAGRLKRLFQSSPEDVDLAVAVQDWETKGGVELSDLQLKRALAPIRRNGIRVAREFVANSPHGPLRETAEDELAIWLDIEAEFAGALGQ